MHCWVFLYKSMCISKRTHIQEDTYHLDVDKFVAGLLVYLGQSLVTIMLQEKNTL